MSKCKLFVFLGGALVLVAVVILVGSSKPSSTDEFHALIHGHLFGHIEAITFRGQQKEITIVDPNTLSQFESALAGVSTNVYESGTTYDICLRFKSGRTFNSFGYIYKDDKGFAIADKPKTLLADPSMIDIRFQNVSPRIHQLLKNLRE